MGTQVNPSLSVFLCHSSADKPAVRELYERLRENGYLPWLDEEDLVAGQEWDKEIAATVRRSDVVLVCLSRDSINKKGFVQKEIKFALDVADEQPEGAIFIIPVKLEECEVPNRLRHWHWVEYFDERGYERLIRALDRCANGVLRAREKLPIHKSATDRATPTASRAGEQQTPSEDIEGNSFLTVPPTSRFLNVIKNRWLVVTVITISLVILGISFLLLRDSGRTNVVDNASEQVFSHKDISVPKGTLIQRPHTTEEFYENGTYFLSIRSYDAAISDLRQAVMLQPNFPLAHNRLGSALMYKGQFREAEAAFRTAIEQRGGRFPTAQYNLGYALQLQRENEKAVEAYRKAIEQNGGVYSDAYYQIGSVLLETPARPAEAADAFRKAIEQNEGRDPEAQRLLGVALVQRKDYASAEAAFREAVNQRGGGFALAHYNLGLLYQQTGRTEEAIEAFENYLHQEPGELAFTHYDLGVFCQRAGKIDKAIKEFEIYLQQSPGDGNRRSAENTLRGLRQQAARRHTK